MAGNLVKYMLQINNIPWTIGRQQLALYFSQFGYVQNATVVFDKQTGFSQGYGYITFLKKQHVDSVLQHEHTLDGQNLSVMIKYGGEDLNNEKFDTRN
ncbi:PREDICTED: SRA stem-loop-interacting RNA-binding protein, mitochondrial-like [Dinoponera quadriceps]|uniref:SRA stem-loop-interacting RNA-binding protein, mitochondrial-like n=1 Tax=Dinoponera quadriceps TaxID=609295 RepID=A0A6P3XTY1_DINQU|nr:PREDICTED: SRA stem-loop-interacting RNA-binding protein, mitochondrial-like [Dinoponera quadriceps]